MESILTNSLRRADRFWLLDGAMGTQLQNKLRQRGQDPFGLQPELLNLTHPEIVTEVHREYLLAGAQHPVHQHLRRQPQEAANQRPHSRRAYLRRRPERKASH